MVVGSVLAVAQTDMKRMLAYSSVAHAGFLLTGLLGVRLAADVGTDEITALQAVLFYLATYGFTTVGAFAIVTLVRDAGGEATQLSRWAGLGTRSPLVAGSFALPAARHGRHPADRRFIGKWAVFAVALGGRCLAGGRSSAVAGVGGRGVLLRAGDRADVLRRARRGGRRRVAEPSLLTCRPSPSVSR